MEDEAGLQKLLDFDDADLYANRAGYMTSHQKEHWKAELRADQKFARTFGWVCLGLIPVTLVLFILVRAEGRNWMVWAYSVMPILGLLAITALFRGTPTAAQRKVHTVEGPLFIIKGEKEAPAGQAETGAGCRLRVGEMEFEAQIELGGMVEEGTAYSIYYLAAPRRILSLERMWKREES